MNDQRKISFFDFTMIVVGLVIGMGIFRTASTVASASNNPIIYLSSWLIGGLIAFCGALTYAEIGSRFPVTGGYYRILAYTYHPAIAFAINAIIIVSNASTLGGVVLIGSGYICRVAFHNANTLIENSVAILAIIIFYIINLFGIKQSSKIQNILMIVKITMIIVLILPLFFMTAHPHHSLLPDRSNNSSWWGSLGLSLIAVSFTYGGYQQTINFGEEVKNPSKTIPKSIFTGIAIIVTLYLLINLSYLKVIGFEELKSTNEVASTVISYWLGENAGKIFAMLLFFSVLAYVNVLLLSNPRVLYAMSTDGAIPSMFGRISSKKSVPIIALTFFTGLSILILLFAGTFEKILGFSIFLDSVGMVISAAAIFKLRKRMPEDNNRNIYKIKFYPLIPLLFITAYIVVAINICLSTPISALIGVAVICSFVFIYFVTAKK